MASHAISMNGGGNDNDDELSATSRERQASAWYRNCGMGAFQCLAPFVQTIGSFIGNAFSTPQNPHDSDVFNPAKDVEIANEYARPHEKVSLLASVPEEDIYDDFDKHNESDDMFKISSNYQAATRTTPATLLTDEETANLNDYQDSHFKFLGKEAESLHVVMKPAIIETRLPNIAHTNDDEFSAFQEATHDEPAPTIVQQPAAAATVTTTTTIAVNPVILSATIPSSPQPARQKIEEAEEEEIIEDDEDFENTLDQIVNQYEEEEAADSEYNFAQGTATNE